MTCEERLLQLGIKLPTDVAASGSFEVALKHDGMLYLSGQIPRENGRVVFAGKVGQAINLEEAREAARICAIRLLAATRDVLGTLNAVSQVLQVSVFVNSTPDFVEPSAVADAASAVFKDVFGTVGRHARTAVCVNQLPGGACVEISAVLCYAGAPASDAT